MAKATPSRAKSAARRRPTVPDTLGIAIVDHALLVAERDGWEGVRLRAIAEELGVPLTDVLVRFRDLDAVANAWFARALLAMLADPGRDFLSLAYRDRIEILLLRWFDALSPHHNVTAQMLAAKLWPFHPHHYVPMVFDLSRLIQWVRDAAGLDAGGRRRQIEEIGLTSLFLVTLAAWCRDTSPDQEATRALLRANLDRADGLMARLFPRPEVGA